MASVREIAKYARVSKTTVSMVLRNQEGVSEAMRKRVQEAVDNLRAIEETRAADALTSAPGWRMGSSSPGSQDKISSLLVLHPTNYHSSTVFHEILRGIQAAASVYQLQLSLAFNDTSLLHNSFEELYFSNSVLKPVGVLVIGAKADEPLIQRLTEHSIPVVLVGRKSQNERASSVGRNEQEMAREATNFLFDLGHRRLAFLGASDEFQYAIDRLTGFREVVEQRWACEKSSVIPVNVGMPASSASAHGRPAAWDENLVHYGFDKQASADFLIRHPEITGTVFVNELLASQVLPLVQAAGRLIPDDLSVVAFDDTEIARNFNPPLTTISFPFFQEGFWSVRLIMEQVRQPTILSAQVTLGASLVKRESCGTPKTML